MTEFVDNLSYEELLAENANLKITCEEFKKEIELLKNKIVNLKDKINDFQDNQSDEICEFFNDCNSLKKTAKHFLYDNIVDCGDDLINFNGCTDAIQDAKDYKEYYFQKYGHNEDSDEDK